MKIENPIGWTDATTNAVTGCDRVSTGCRFCYAEAGTRARVLRSQGRETWGPKGERVPVNFEPVFRRLNKLCICDKCHEAQEFSRLHHVGRCEWIACYGKLRRIRLFADSNSDWLDHRWPVETLAKFLDSIRLAPNVDVILLTKRIESFTERMIMASLYAGGYRDGQELNESSDPSEKPNEALRDWLMDWTKERITVPSNLWLGVSVEDQKRADERIPLLLKTPATVRFLSVEPLLSSIEFSDVTNRADGVAQLGRKALAGIDWVIVGGESGKNRRDCGARAIESVVEQCVHAGVPVFCKQDAALLPGHKGRIGDDHWKRKEFPK